MLARHRLIAGLTLALIGTFLIEAFNFRRCFLLPPSCTTGEWAPAIIGLVISCVGVGIALDGLLAIIHRDAKLNASLHGRNPSEA